jgi:hypothetical protein
MYRITYYDKEIGGTGLSTAVVKADDMNQWLVDNKHNKIIEIYYEKKTWVKSRGYSVEDIDLIIELKEKEIKEKKIKEKRDGNAWMGSTTMDMWKEYEEQGR